MLVLSITSFLYSYYTIWVILTVRVNAHSGHFCKRIYNYNVAIYRLGSSGTAFICSLPLCTRATGNSISSPIHDCGHLHRNRHDSIQTTPFKYESILSAGVEVIRM